MKDQPVSGALMQLYAAGSTPIPLLDAEIRTDPDGRFLVPASYLCPSPGAQLYLTARANTSASHHAVDLMAALGSCDALKTPAEITVDEASTAISRHSFARLKTSSTQVASTPVDLSQPDQAPAPTQASTQAPTQAPAAALLPAASSFTIPPANQCQSTYDQFYLAEPGVYAYWALCEPNARSGIFDYAGRFDLTPASHAWSSGTYTIRSGAPGPVPDSETADQVTTGSSYIANQNIPLNSNQGTLATWVNTDSTRYPSAMMFFGAVNGRSAVSLSAINPANTECFTGSFTNTAGRSFSLPPACGFPPNSWQRVVFTWNHGTLNLYVGGVSVSTTTYTGPLDNKVFVYRLFPETANTGKQMTLAKALISNLAWTPAQVASDDSPAFVQPPPGGVYITQTQLGTIHRDVLGYVDVNADISTPALVAALTSGLSQTGVTSVRYTGGGPGDLENWQGGVSCTAKKGVTTPPENAATQNQLDNFVTRVAQPLQASLGFLVNYGTNPPACNAGGDPITNGANLVDYANNQKQYGIKYWEIGNELFNGGVSEVDFHPLPGNGASYASYEKLFAAQMKQKDSTIQIGIPVGDGVYSWLANWTLPAINLADYDAVVYHNYPIVDPITDGQTLYPDRVASNRVRTHGSLLALQTELLNANKSPDAIWITEWNADIGLGLWSRQSLGAVVPMFATMELAEYMQAGVQYATWFAQGMSNACLRFNYDWSGESAYNWWDCGGDFLTYTSNFPAETPVGFAPGNITPAARAFQLLSTSGFVTEGEHMLRTVSDLHGAPWLSAYAATHGSSYALILINRDRDAAHTVPIQIAATPAGQGFQQWTYGLAQYDQTKAGIWTAGIVSTTGAPWTATANVALPPWSVNVVVFEPAAPAPTQ